MAIKIITVVEDANTITKGIVNQLKSEGHCARRINTTGIWDEKKQCFRKGGAESGTADIIACIKPKGFYMAIEVKYDKDTQSKAQKAFQKEVQDAGGLYLIVKTWDYWKRWWDNYKELNYLNK